MAYKDPRDPRRLAYVKDYNRRYREKNRQYFRDAYNKWAKENPDKNIQRRNKYLSTRENRLKSSARSAVYYAIRKGTLVRPELCSRCNLPGKIEADHSDYTKKLDVTWLCKTCHSLVTTARRML